MSGGIGAGACVDVSVGTRFHLKRSFICKTVSSHFHTLLPCCAAAINLDPLPPCADASNTDAPSRFPCCQLGFPWSVSMRHATR